jgi:hypothetical protein
MSPVNWKTTSHDEDGVLNDQVVFAAFHRGSGRICYSEPFPKDWLITWARWVDIKDPAAAVVDEAIGWRRRMKE